MLKYNRSYYLSIGTSVPTAPVNVQLPFTVEFDVKRNYTGAANNFSFRIYNLGEETRTRIRKDVYSFDSFRPIIFNAGYQNQLKNLLSGNIVQAYSVREGVDFITEILGLDAGFAFVNGVTTKNYPAGVPLQSIVTDLMTSLTNYNVQVGAIGSFPGNTSRGTSLSGNTASLLTELTGGAFYIDNGVAYALGNNECTEDPIYIVSSATGLLGTPRLEETIVHVDMLFEPTIRVGSRVQLESTTNRGLTTDSSSSTFVGSTTVGIYKVTEVHHKGIISPVVCGQVTTSLSLQSGAFNPVAGVGL